MTTFQESLRDHLLSGYQMLLVQTHEERRCLVEINNLIRTTKSSLKEFNVFVWDFADGLVGVTDSVSHRATTGAPENQGPDAILQYLLKLLTSGVSEPMKHIYVLQDMHKFTNDPEVCRLIRHIFHWKLCSSNNPDVKLIFLQPPGEVPNDLKHCLTEIEFGLPDDKDLADVLDFVLDSYFGNKENKPDNEELKSSCVIAGRGLTANEFEDACSLALTRSRGKLEDAPKTIEHQKKQILKTTSSLTYISPDEIESMDSFAGWDGFIEFMERQAVAFSKAGRDAGLEPPRGVGLIGVPGTGKSVAGKAAARLLSEKAKRPMPLVILDVGAMFNSLVGKTEENVRMTLKTVDALGGCALFIDEIDKAFSGMSSSSTDSGVSQRVFGSILTWLTSKKSDTFVIVTMNRIENLPPELLRKGRFDEIFAVELPDFETRKKIFEIHFRKRGVDPTKVATTSQWNTLAEKSSKFVGSEIEEAVRTAINQAFYARQDKTPTYAELFDAVAGTRSLYSLNPESITKMEEYAKTKARSVKTKMEMHTPTVKTSRRISSTN